MKSVNKTIYLTAGIAGALMICGAAALLIRHHCKRHGVCGVFLCDHTEIRPTEPETAPDAAPTEPAADEAENSEEVK